MSLEVLKSALHSVCEDEWNRKHNSGTCSYWLSLVYELEQEGKSEFEILSSLLSSLVSYSSEYIS